VCGRDERVKCVSAGCARSGAGSSRRGAPFVAASGRCSESARVRERGADEGEKASERRRRRRPASERERKKK